MGEKRKRAVCLYRVSTLGQVEKDDIPMQRQACREFAEAQGWDIVEEKSEKGISGYKVAAADRDEIQDVKREVLEGRYDVLLVFMFDRLGRREDETPFIVQWFVQHGVEVWSVKEGEQRFDTHVDKLMNYIRYWQASGESEKTSIRVKTRLSQIVQEGRFRGGVPAYGYKTEKQGRLNNRGHEVLEIMVDPDEAAVVKLIFDKYIHEGYGSHRIANHLTDIGVKTRKGSTFVNCTIQNMLKNETYLGIIKCGETQTDVFPELQIIDQDTFEMAQELLRQRSSAFQERTAPLHTKGRGLLSGNVFCGHCGARLVQTSNTKHYRNADGSMGKQYTRVRYVCYNKTRYREQCDGQTGYTVSKVDERIDRIIRGILERIKDLPTESTIDVQYNSRITELAERLKTTEQNLAEKQNAYDSYKLEMQRVIKGESVLDRQAMTEIIVDSKNALDAALSEYDDSKAKLEDTHGVFAELKKEHDRMLSWVDLYDTGSPEAKKMVVANIIQRATIKRDYEISLDLNISYDDYIGNTSEIEESVSPGMSMQ